MLSSLVRFTVPLTLASSVFAAVIPITTVVPSPSATATVIGTIEPHPSNGPIAALWKNNVHDKIYLSEAPAATPTAEGLVAVRRSGELWFGVEHEQLDPIAVSSTSPALPRRSGELWYGAEHEQVDPSLTGPLPRRSGELWYGAEHEQVDPSSTGPALPRRSGELWYGAEHEQVDPSSTGPALPRRSGELWFGAEHEAVSATAF